MSPWPYPMNTGAHSLSVPQFDNQLPVLHFGLHLVSVFQSLGLQVPLWKFSRVERVADLHGEYGVGILLQDNYGRGVESQNCD
jgi:hypothetical protein